MKKAFYILVCTLLLSCNQEDAWDCIQTAGEINNEEIEVPRFHRIQLEGDVSMVLSQSNKQEIYLNTGENLRNDFYVGVEDGTLVIRNNNRCNLSREYAISTVYVATDTLTHIRHSSPRNIMGVEILRFPSLTLESNSTGGPEISTKSGNFYLGLDISELVISANGQSVFNLYGFCENANIVFSDEFPRFEGPDFRIQNLKVLQRSANKMVVFPTQSITGSIFGTGDILSLYQPEEVQVEETWTGRLLFL
ncbi:head GIN domain-containing protein [Luteirhabdus pelagi]|uniref:head GIN domain-containing protein n=1 Tax=Luteirhabdus pelagi TaxID=2792783 RepID=UPI00193A5ED2|nr:head GIN domain-containing protein [Luteirhabdus pelagi]